MGASEHRFIAVPLSTIGGFKTLLNKRTSLANRLNNGPPITLSLSRCPPICFCGFCVLNMRLTALILLMASKWLFRSGSFCFAIGHFLPLELLSCCLVAQISSLLTTFTHRDNRHPNGGLGVICHPARWSLLLHLANLQ